jgi:hypothetical protein
MNEQSPVLSGSGCGSNSSSEVFSSSACHVELANCTWHTHWLAERIMRFGASCQHFDALMVVGHRL